MDYVKKLKERHELTKENLDSALNIDVISNIYTETMNYYCKTLIPDFFSSRGEGKRIKDMYQNLDLYQYSTFVQESALELVDLNVASCAYQDYLHGMRTFIEETCGCCIDGEIYAKESAVCEEKLASARTNDGKFIESIFGGCNNEKHTENVLEAAKNVEFLIDFLSNIKEESTRCGITIDKIKTAINNGNQGESLLIESAKLMVESVNDYVYHAISEIFESYQSINEVLEHRKKFNTVPTTVGEYTVW